MLEFLRQIILIKIRRLQNMPIGVDHFESVFHRFSPFKLCSLRRLVETNIYIDQTSASGKPYRAIAIALRGRSLAQSTTLDAPPAASYVSKHEAGCAQSELLRYRTQNNSVGFPAAAQSFVQGDQVRRQT